MRGEFTPGPYPTAPGAEPIEQCVLSGSFKTAMRGVRRVVAMNSHSIPGATGQHTTAGRPRGYSSITPFLAVPGAARALDFYSDVFGATIRGVTEMPGPDGLSVVVHAEVVFADGRLQLGEPSAEYGLVPPAGDGQEASYSIGLYVPDADRVVDAAVAAGAVVREPLATFVSGDRYASIVDPFGVRWTIMCRVEDLSEDESDARVAAWAAQQASAGDQNRG